MDRIGVTTLLALIIAYVDKDFTKLMESAKVII